MEVSLYNFYSLQLNTYLDPEHTKLYRTLETCILLYNRIDFSNKTIFTVYTAVKRHTCHGVFDYIISSLLSRIVYIHIHTSLRFQYTKHSAASLLHDFMIILKRYSKCCFMSPETLDKNQLYICECIYHCTHILQFFAPFAHMNMYTIAHFTSERVPPIFWQDVVLGSLSNCELKWLSINEVYCFQCCSIFQSSITR